jgi:hypothetical protein
MRAGIVAKIAADLGAAVHARPVHELEPHVFQALQGVA